MIQNVYESIQQIDLNGFDKEKYNTHLSQPSLFHFC